MNVPDFLQKISVGLKSPITKEDIFGSEIKLRYLKRIDKLFEKGLHYYLDPKAPEASKDASVFFRKQNFQTDELNFGAIKIVNKFEELKLSLSAIAKLSDFDLKRKLDKYTINQNPKDVAKEIRSLLYPNFEKDRRDFLKALIESFASKNILVFEFIETWNKKDIANIDGFYLKPNTIVLKRHQTFSREIFTLAHELGHYLIDEEEIEELSYKVLASPIPSANERWCNDFAFYFLAGNDADYLNKLEKASPHNDYHHGIINKISEKTHLSKLALFTRLLINKQISITHYYLVKNEFDVHFKQMEEEKKNEKELAKERGIKKGGAIPKPIASPLFISTIQTAYYEGVLNEYEVCEKLNIKPENLDKYIE
ncbi:MAG: ImmA/IrrE family metallo-endopeptidase [Candidatus Saccharimonadaceae bacterium]